MNLLFFKKRKKYKAFDPEIWDWNHPCSLQITLVDVWSLLSVTFLFAGLDQYRTETCSASHAVMLHSSRLSNRK